MKRLEKEVWKRENIVRKILTTKSAVVEIPINLDVNIAKSFIVKAYKEFLKENKKEKVNIGDFAYWIIKDLRKTWFSLEDLLTK